MKKQKRRARNPNPRTTGEKTGDTTAAGGSSNGVAPPKSSSRRNVLRKLRNGALVVAVVGAGGWYLVEDVSATHQEHDLSRIGNGTPSVVQIHDPQCPTCQALQRETRAALSDFDDGQLQYLVANIRSVDGRQFAAAHDVGHVTLLIFDADGQRKEVLVGSNTRDYLSAVFRRHAAKSGSTS